MEVYSWENIGIFFGKIWLPLDWTLPYWFINPSNWDYHGICHSDTTTNRIIMDNWDLKSTIARIRMV
jgi:hypothetical protein